MSDEALALRVAEHRRNAHGDGWPCECPEAVERDHRLQCLFDYIDVLQARIHHLLTAHRTGICDACSDRRTWINATRSSRP